MLGRLPAGELIAHVSCVLTSPVVVQKLRTLPCSDVTATFVLSKM